MGKTKEYGYNSIFCIAVCYNAGRIFLIFQHETQPYAFTLPKGATPHPNKPYSAAPKGGVSTINEIPMNTSIPPRRHIRKSIRFDAYQEVIRSNLNKQIASSGRRLTLPAKLPASILWSACLPPLLLLCLSLISFNMNDPAWSRSVAPVEIHNLCGLYGAYFADITLYLFGLSSWLLPVGLFLLWWKKCPLCLDTSSERPPYRLDMAFVGFVLLALSAPALEYILFGNSLDGRLPIGAGGLGGHILGTLSVRLFTQPAAATALTAVTASALLSISQLSLWQIIKNTAAGIFAAISRLLQEKPAYTKQTLLVGSIQRMTAKTKSITDIPMPPFSLAQCGRNRIPVPLRRTPTPPENKPIPTDTISNYTPPPSELLLLPHNDAPSADFETLQQTARKIEYVLSGLGLGARVVSAISGPVLTRYEIRPKNGVKGSQIALMTQELARVLSLKSIRVSDDAGSDNAAIEIPNTYRRKIKLRTILSSPAANVRGRLLLALGQDVAGMPVVGDLGRMPSLLLAGKKGAGKATAIHGMILSLLYRNTPEDVRLAVIAPKQSNFPLYNRIPHMLCPVVSTLKETRNLLDWCIVEMEKRYRLLHHLQARDLPDYNAKITSAAKKPFDPFSPDPDRPETLSPLPALVLFVTELAAASAAGEAAIRQIAHLAAEARAVGIHIIAATQYPEVNVLTRRLKAAFPTRMAFAVDNKIESRIILDQVGAEGLLREGDSLFLQSGHVNPIRLQCAFASETEIRRVAEYLSANTPTCYLDGLLTGEAAERTIRAINPHTAKDELFDRAAEMVIKNQKASVSFLQRNLNIGYNRAANLLAALEHEGIVSQDTGRGREILVKKRHSRKKRQTVGAANHSAENGFRAVGQPNRLGCDR